jgi:hypothetical protein
MPDPGGGDAAALPRAPRLALPISLKFVCPDCGKHQFKTEPGNGSYGFHTCEKCEGQFWYATNLFDGTRLYIVLSVTGRQRYLYRERPLTELLQALGVHKPDRRDAA